MASPRLHAVRSVLPPADGPVPAGAPARDLARAVAPATLARDRCLRVPGPWGDLVGEVGRGQIVVVEGRPGSGVTSLGLALAAAATDVGEWAGALDPGGTLGGLAAVTAGVAPERFAVVRRVPRGRWATVVAALLDGVTVVLAPVPPGLRVGDARRLAARARERQGVLVVLESSGTAGARVGRWPGEASRRLRPRVRWRGQGPGLLVERALALEVVEHGRVRRVARAG